MRKEINRFKTCIDKFNHDIKNTERLNYNDEINLGNSIKNGSISDRNKMVESNLKLVMKIAHKYKCRGVSYEDLVSEGNKGLIIAAEKFDPTLGFRFSTYAYYWIRALILQSIKKEKEWNDCLVDIEITCDDFDNVEKDNKKDISYFKSYYEEQKEVDDTIDYDKILDSVVIHINILTEREQNIVKHYFGIGGYNEMNISELSEKYDVTNMRVSTILDDSIRKIRCAYVENNFN